MVVSVFNTVIDFFLSLFSVSKKLIPYGKLEKKLYFNIAENTYQFEQYVFNDSIDSYRYYRKVVSDHANKNGILTTKYDLYDWSYTYFLFEKHSFKVNRFGNKLQCIKSLKAVSLNHFERDVSTIIKQMHD